MKYMSTLIASLIASMDAISDAIHSHAVNVLMYFVVVTLLFQPLAKHSSAALPCK